MQSNLKYRPEELKEIVGNQETVKSLTSLFSEKERPHTFLFSGKAGCGKTTFARIICNMLECKEEGIVELNMSNNRGIDTAREIIQNAPFPPLVGEVKAYILDEVHKTTNDFQNAMLKILEEPPEHVYFILCTTNPEILLQTVLGRCTKYHLSLLNPGRMRRLLDAVIANETLSIDEKVITAIIKHAGGVPRDALIMLDKVSGVDNLKLQLKAISSVDTERKLIIDLCRALYDKKKWEVIADILKRIEAEPEETRRAILGYFTTVLLKGKDARVANILEQFSDNYYDSGFSGLVLSCYMCFLE